jgi:hypothetical protein
MNGESKTTYNLCRHPSAFKRSNNVIANKQNPSSVGEFVAKKEFVGRRNRIRILSVHYTQINADLRKASILPCWSRQYSVECL